MMLYDGQGPGHAADGGGREGARGRCCRPGRCGKAQSDALLAEHGFCALAGIAGAARCATCHPAPGVTQRALRPRAAWNPAGIEAIVCGHGHVDHATGLPSPPSASSRWQAARSSAGFHLTGPLVGGHRHRPAGNLQQM